METLTVTIRNKEEERVLKAFLDSLNYNYHAESDDDNFMTDEQMQMLLQRKQDFLDGKTTARSWEEIKKELSRVYH